MGKKILGLDLGSNSVGWALYEEIDGQLNNLIDLGSRIFSKAVEEKVPTPKNVKRRDMRLGRRVLQRRAGRKQRMLNYLISLQLLPKELANHSQPEILLNEIGDPYALRTKALDKELSPYQFGRVLLHFVARRGFLSSKKQVAGDLVDDPDTLAFLNEVDGNVNKDKEEGQFKADIAELRSSIEQSGFRTLGEYLHHLPDGHCKRNRNHDGGHLRTDRAMYQKELSLIWQKQQTFFKNLPSDFMQEDAGVKQIIFYQRPLKLRKDRVGRCSLETHKNRAPLARLEVQRFRYLQDINNLAYFERHSEQQIFLAKRDKEKLTNYFEQHSKVTITGLKKQLGLDRFATFNLETKNLKGNITSCEIRSVLANLWDDLSGSQQLALVEDLLTIKKKSALKRRLLTFWNFDTEIAVRLSLLEFEPGHSNLSLKAINKLLPYLEQGDIYSEARCKAGYDYQPERIVAQTSLNKPPETSNPIVNKGLHELKRVINAIIKQYGKPDAIRIEMARDLEMNTKRYKAHQARQKKNENENTKAIKAYQGLGLGKYPSYEDKIKYRLWAEQGKQCAYSCEPIALNAVFTAEVEIDHILPYKKSLDDSYMNKALCFAKENQNKGARTPKDAWGTEQGKWEQITQAISRWKGVDGKVSRFFKTEKELQKRDFISNQLNDTRYIAKVALGYVEQLGCEVSTSKGITTAWLRHQWGLNSLLGESSNKERTDHRHHAIDAAVVACVDRSLYQQILNWTKGKKQRLVVGSPYPNYREELEEHLKHVIVSHDIQGKLSGALHEETGAGYIESHGGLVYRKNLDQEFTAKKAEKIVDETVKEIVLAHLAQFGNDPKVAFSAEHPVYHKDGSTPIKRVRVLQSKANQAKLKSTKFGVRDKTGKIFKWMAYGNMHHVEIIQDKASSKYTGVFVTMMQASHRAKGIKSHLNPEGSKCPIVNKQHGEQNQFVMSLKINDLVSIANEQGERVFYRVQKLDQQNKKFVLRVHFAATLGDKSQELSIPINKDNFDKYKLKLHRVNILGININD